jgi:hypothetical protein
MKKDSTFALSSLSATIRILCSTSHCQSGVNDNCTFISAMMYIKKSTVL